MNVKKKLKTLWNISKITPKGGSIYIYLKSICHKWTIYCSKRNNSVGECYKILQIIQVWVVKNYNLIGSEDGWQNETCLLLKPNRICCGKGRWSFKRSNLDNKHHAREFNQDKLHGSLPHPLLSPCDLVFKIQVSIWEDIHW